MSDRLSVYNLTMSYFIIIIVALAMLQMGNVNRAFAADIRHQGPAIGREITNTAAILSAGAVPGEQNSVIGPAAERKQDKVMIDTVTQEPLIVTPEIPYNANARLANNTNKYQMQASFPDQNPEAGQQADSAIEESRPANRSVKKSWYIHIASFRNGEDADEMVKHAKSMGVDAIKQYVTVNGKNYWRISVEGPSLLDDAKLYATMIKDRLGLKDVWISKESGQP